MTTTLGFAMFSFEGDKTVEALAKYFRNLKEKDSFYIASDAMDNLVITALENLINIDEEKFGEATDTAVREAVLMYVHEGVRTVTLDDGVVREFPPTLTSDDYDHLAD